MTTATAIATLFGIGRLKPGPGTWASAVALAAGVMLHRLGGFPLLALATLAVTGIGWWAIRAALPAFDRADPSEIVIDEVAGQWLTLLAPSLAFWLRGIETLPYPAWIGAFLAFRLCDIWKPWLVGRADDVPGATGVMLDDLVAGVFAALLVMAAAAFAHGVLMR